MTSAKSRTRSGTTSRRRRRKRPPTDAAFHLPTFYIDESASQHYVPDALRTHEVKVKRRRDVFPEQPWVEDVVWLAHCGRYQWVAITKDHGIRHRANEIAMVRNAKVRMFVIGRAELTGQQQAELLVRALPAIRRWVKTQPAPFIVRIGADARTELIDIGRNR